MWDCVSPTPAPNCVTTLHQKGVRKPPCVFSRSLISLTPASAEQTNWCFCLHFLQPGVTTVKVFAFSRSSILSPLWLPLDFPFASTGSSTVANALFFPSLCFHITLFPANTASPVSAHNYYKYHCCDIALVQSPVPSQLIAVVFLSLFS